MPEQKHEFAVFIDQFSYLITSIAPGGILTLEGEDIYHRLIRVLRLRPDDACILFDQEMHGRFVLQELQGKTRIQGILHTKQSNTVLYPTITVWLPLLKRDDADMALYALTEIGVNNVHLVNTEKVQRLWGGERERARLQRIIIAAAEQSKNFAFPNLSPPISFDDALTKAAGTKIFCDPAGSPLFTVMEFLHTNRPEHVSLFVGPEGDLTTAEKERMKKEDVIFCALTPTVLRSVQAAAIGSGVIRSILSTHPL